MAARLKRPLTWFIQTASHIRSDVDLGPGLFLLLSPRSHPGRQCVPALTALLPAQGQLTPRLPSLYTLGRLAPKSALAGIMSLEKGGVVWSSKRASCFLPTHGLIPEEPYGFQK